MISETDRRDIFTRSMESQQEAFAAEEKAQQEPESARAADFGRSLLDFEAEFSRNECARDAAYAAMDEWQENAFQMNETIRETIFATGQENRTTAFQADQQKRAERSALYASVRETRIREGHQLRKAACAELEAALIKQFEELIALQESSLAAEERRRDQVVEEIKLHQTEVADDISSESSLSVESLDDFNGKFTDTDSAFIRTPSLLPAQSVRLNTPMTVDTLNVSSSEIIPWPRRSRQLRVSLLRSRSISSNIKDSGTSAAHTNPAYDFLGDYANTANYSDSHVHSDANWTKPSARRKSVDTSDSSANSRSSTTEPPEELLDDPKTAFPPTSTDLAIKAPQQGLMRNPTHIEYPTIGSIPSDDEARPNAIQYLRQPVASSVTSSASTDSDPGSELHVSALTNSSNASASSSDSHSNLEPSPARSSGQTVIPGAQLTQSPEQLSSAQENDSNNTPTAAPASFFESVKRAASRLTSRSSGEEPNHSRQDSGSSSADAFDERFRSDEEQRQQAFLFEEGERENRFKAAEEARDAAEDARDKAYEENQQVRFAKFDLREAKYRQSFSYRESSRIERGILRQRSFEAGQSHRMLLFDQSLSWAEKESARGNTLEDEMTQLMKNAIEKLVVKHKQALEKARDGFYTRFSEAQRLRAIELGILNSPAYSPISPPLSSPSSPSVSFSSRRPSISEESDLSERSRSHARSRSPSRRTNSPRLFMPSSPAAGFAAGALLRGANAQEPLPVPGLYEPSRKRGDYGFRELQRRRQYFFEKAQYNRELAFEANANQRKCIFHLGEQRRRLEFTKKQAKRAQTFEAHKNTFELKFRNTQREREKRFTLAESERQANFRESESSRELIFSTSQKNMNEAFHALQEKLQKMCFVAEDQRLKELEAWASGLLEERKKQEDDHLARMKVKCQDIYQAWIRTVL